MPIAENRVEIGHVQLADAKAFDVSVRQFPGIARGDRLARDRFDRHILVAQAGPGVNSAPASHVDHADDSHAWMLHDRVILPCVASVPDDIGPNAAESARTAMPTCGWDIGGANLKVARVDHGAVLAARTHPFELQRDPAHLIPLLHDLRDRVGHVDGPHAVTMTAELSQMFRTKREGVRFVVDAVQAAFSSEVVRVFSVDGSFISADDARTQPLRVAAANWAATARAVAHEHPDALLIDVGSTTTDIVPIVGGTVVARGHTDPERLVSGELVYTGALRTPTEAIASVVPVGDALAGVSAEGFALSGDVHVWRGDLEPRDYTCATPDGRPTTREFAGERLARVVCADREMLDEVSITRVADALARAQVRTIHSAIQRVIERHPSIEIAVVTGLGAFLGVAAVRGSRLRVIPLSSRLGEAGARAAPAVAVALLLERASAAHS